MPERNSHLFESSLPYFHGIDLTVAYFRQRGHIFGGS
jgi:hypothetical protein